MPELKNMDSGEDRVVALLRQMVATESVNGNTNGSPFAEADMIAFLAEQAQADGLSVRRLAVTDHSDELMITYAPNPDGSWILFDSHVDTVSVTGMTIDPFAAEIRDDKMWGRGAADTKASGAAMYCALCDYAASVSGHNNIALLFSIDEESGMTGIQAFLSRHLPDLKLRLRGAIVGEPTELKPVLAHNGVIRYLLQTFGVAAHSADPSRGKSAISDMARLILFLEENSLPKITATHPMTGKAQASINVVRGGSVVNIIPDRCRAEVDRRVVPGEDAEEVVSAFRAMVEAFSNAYPDATVTVEKTQGTPPLTPEEGPGWSSKVTAVLNKGGYDSAPAGVRYATHGGFLSEAGIPSVVLGPGNIAQAHTKDEWIELAQVRKSVGIYRTVMEMGG